MDSLKKEFKQYLNIYSFDNLKTIYIGGGTPALNVRCLEQVFNIVTSSITLSSDIEFTLECNPLNINKELIRLCNNFACNRISMGVQSFSDKIISEISREGQTRELLKNALQELQESDFNVSIDLINGLPGLNVDDEIEALAFFLASYPVIKHLSFYELSIDEGSKFYQEKEKLSLPEESKLIDYESELSKSLLKHHFNRYEISNFSKQGFESRHNLGYWKYKNYIGLGPGAHSTVNGLRVENAADIELYIKSKNYKTEYSLSLKEQIEEYLLMGLRLIEGVSLVDFEERFGIELSDIIPETLSIYRKRGELCCSDNRSVKLIGRGFDILNTILVDMFTELERFI